MEELSELTTQKKEKIQKEENNFPLSSQKKLVAKLVFLVASQFPLVRDYIVSWSAFALSGVTFFTMIHSGLLHHTFVILTSTVSPPVAPL